jgi:hypothetical protein
MGDDVEKKYMIEGEDCGRVAFPRSKHYGREGGGGGVQVLKCSFCREDSHSGE